MWQFGWMLSLIPDSLFIWITYILFGIGVALYVASKLVVWIPYDGAIQITSRIGWC
jgi:uncharacterized membrane protein YczE